MMVVGDDRPGRDPQDRNQAEKLEQPPAGRARARPCGTTRPSRPARSRRVVELAAGADLGQPLRHEQLRDRAVPQDLHHDDRVGLELIRPA